MMRTASTAPTGARHARLFRFLQEASARLLVGGLFLAMAWRLGEDFLKTGRQTDLLMLVGESLVVVLTCLRRQAHTVDRRFTVRLVTTISLMSPLLIRPGPVGGLIPEAAAVIIGAIGLIVVIAGKLSLGYSFGLLPANRGVMDRGLYRVIRHPIYMGYLISHLPFLASHPSLWNAAVLLAGDTALILRAFYEEQTLSGDPKYVHYCRRVKWLLVPGVC
jgi:protein-S-isoprenylcysteine O-methyltransferase Ste14